MVSFETPFAQLDDHQIKTLSENNDERNSKNMKRKWNDSQVDEVILPYKHWKNPKPNNNTTTTTSSVKSFSNIELHLETPLPSEWQRCLDIQSGEIHFYNSRTQKRTMKDPREKICSLSDPQLPRDSHMSLDLELNLPCGSLNHNNNNSPKSTPEKNNNTHTVITNSSNNKNSPPKPKTQTSMDLFIEASIEGNDDSTEMVATACKRCHMLVMLCKSAPTCPNCKYVHPPCQGGATTLDLFKPRLSLSY